MEEKIQNQQVQTVSSQSNEFVNDIVYDGTKKDRSLVRATHKGLALTLSGTFVPTYTGSPVATGRGVMHDLIKEIEIEDGNGDLRNIRPRDMRRITKGIIGSDAPAIYQFNAEEPTAPSVGFFTFTGHTSGQKVYFSETIHIPFENIFAEADFFDTLLEYNGRKDNVIRVDFAKTLRAIQKQSDATVVTYSDVNITLEIEGILTQDKGLGKRWVQRPEERNYSAPVNADIIKLDSVANLMALELSVEYGVDNTPINQAEARKVYFDLIGKKNSVATQILNKASLSQIMNKWMAKKRQPTIIDGYAIMNLISGNQIESATANDFDDFDLRVWLDSSLTKFSEGYNIRALINEIS